MLRQGFPGATWVVAEIANLNKRRGHVYLELTESNEQGQTLAHCRAMIWQRQAVTLLQRFEKDTGSVLAAGQKVLLLMEVSFHEQYGFSMVVQDIDSSYTLGDIEKNLSTIRKQLILEKCYDKNKQLTLPSDYFRVAVIAPPDAAGLGDFRADANQLQALNLCEFKYFYSAFQGDAVQQEMLAAFQAVSALHHSKPFDVLVIIRGGGAKLDLNMLNTYSLAHLVCEAKLPVITGIGHERDTTILDEVANQRFDTPSKVIGHIRHEIFQQAQAALTHWKQIKHSSLLSLKQLEQNLAQLNQTITYKSQQLVTRYKHELEPLQQHIKRFGGEVVSSNKRALNETENRIATQLHHKIALKKLELEQLNLKSKEGTKRVLQQNRQQINQWMALILSSGPKTQLSRGFSIAKKADSQKPITSAKEALKAQRLQLEFIDGAVYVKVDTQKGLL